MFTHGRIKCHGFTGATVMPCLMVKLRPQQEVFSEMQLAHDRARVIVTEIIGLSLLAFVTQRLTHTGIKTAPRENLVDLRGRRRLRGPAAGVARGRGRSPITPPRRKLLNIVNQTHDLNIIARGVDT
jgi:hypothetical protein